MTHPTPITQQARLRATDLLPVATIGARSRPLRAMLSILGVAIGIAALVAVLGVTRSSQADLLARIDRLGTNLLTVVNGHTITGDEVELPTTAAAGIGLTAGVQHVAATTALPQISVYRTDKMPTYRTGGLVVRATDQTLMATLDASLVTGRFLDPTIARYPVAVLGFAAAKTLGIPDLAGQPRVWVGSHWFAVIGILQPLELAPDIDTSVLIGTPIAAADFNYDNHPSRIYVRTDTNNVLHVAGMLARAADPQHPEQVSVARPSDALATRLAVATSTTTLLLGLGAVALLVGGIGIANVMVVAALERRAEIGLRRALGATRCHITTQFITESLILGTAGGIVGITLGTAITYLVAANQHWQPLIPATAPWTGLTTATVIGAVAGVYPALRAARQPPTDALRAN